jgi:site-specific recombinase XerD
MGNTGLRGNLLYGSGLRLVECLRLRVQDIGFGMRQLVVRGGKDRAHKRSLTRMALS